MRNFPLGELKNFNGINNREDPVRLLASRTGTTLVTAKNIDITNSKMVKSRSGYEEKYTGINIHSLWSNGDICLFVEGENLMMLNADLITATALAAGMGIGRRVSYVDAPDKIYFTNGGTIAYIYFENGIPIVSNVPDPDINFKQAIPPGQLIEYYRGRLYIASGDTIWISDAVNLNAVDMRNGMMKMNGEITLLRAVSGGLYVADGKTWFLSGLAPDKEMGRNSLADYNAYLFTDCLVDAELVGDGTLKGKVAFWTSEKGICMGTSDGTFMALTAKNYQIEGSYSRGAGIFRRSTELNQYLTILT